MDFNPVQCGAVRVSATMPVNPMQAAYAARRKAWTEPKIAAWVAEMARLDAIEATKDQPDAK